MARQNVRRAPAVTRTVTHEGGSAYKVRPLDELALTAVSTYLGEDTFYERADTRLTRLIDLLHESLRQVRPTEVFDLIVRLRHDYKIRTASLVLAVEYLRAGAPNARQLIDKVVGRPDEPAEILAYWQARYGKADRRNLRDLPWALRRGLADAVVRQYTERNVLKYGKGRNKLVSMADVIELAHPSPRAHWQGELFRYILDEAHHGDGIERYIGRRQETDGPELHTVYASHQLGQIPEDGRRSKLRSAGYEALADAGYTWERLSGWLPGGMDAEAWEAVIPTMGVMALIRNLRNFDEAGISRDAQAAIVAKITSPDEVSKSRIFPYRTYTAYREAPSDRWKHELNTTLELAAGNMARWDRTLFVVDASGSMGAAISGKAKVNRLEVATTMAALAHSVAKDSDLVLFGQSSALVTPRKGASPLNVAREMAEFNRRRDNYGWGGGPLGYTTYGHTAVRQHFDADKHDRVVIFTDDQMHDDAALSAHVPTIVFFNLAGYAPQSDWGKGRIHVGGFADATFELANELTSR